jgi:glycosyltransferase involved in cell wall biosynthesis
MIIHRYENHGNHNQDAVYRVREMVDHIVSLQPDVVHIHGSGKLSYLIYKALLDKGVRLMLTVHGLLHVEKKNILKRKFSLKHLYQCVVQSYYEFKILNLAKRIIVDTHYVAKQIEAYKQSSFIKQIPEMHVIPQGINEKYLELQLSPNSRTILSVGSISKRKGHLYLLKAFDLLCQKLDDVNLVIAGVLAERSYYQELISYVQKSPNKDKIKILTNLPQEELFKLYTQAKIFALHTQEESQGIVFAEAMATGMPVVATNVGGVPYVVLNEQCGLLSSYSDIETFMNNLYSLLTDTHRYKTMITVAKNIASKYTWNNIADKVLNIYNL